VTKSGDDPAGKPTMIRALWLTRSARPEDGAKSPKNAVALDSLMKQRRLGMFPPSLGSAKLTAARSLASARPGCEVGPQMLER
jgi:hypothetical protein